MRETLLAFLEDRESFVARTEGVSASFIRELLRRGASVAEEVQEGPAAAERREALAERPGRDDGDD